MKKTGLSLILALLVAIITSCNGKMERSPAAKQGNTSESYYALNKGAYSSTEYIEFKKDKFREDMYTETDYSEKVKFKAFVKHKQLAGH